MDDFSEVKKRIMKGWSWKTWLYYYYLGIWFRIYVQPKMTIRSWVIRSLGHFFVKHEEFIDHCKDFYWSYYIDCMFEGQNQ